MPKRINEEAEKPEVSTVTLLPTPRLNLNDLESVRREMARVYRDMRGGVVSTQDGARMVYVLGELRKMFEICDLEKRLAVLEGNDDGK